MKIGFFGGGAQALAILERIASEHEIVFVHPRWVDDPLAIDFARSQNLVVLEDRDINSPPALHEIARSGAELLVSANAKQIFKKDLLDIPSLGAINIHGGLLPRQRGGGGAYVGMINGETNGATVHFIDPGIDSGDILLQREFDLPDDRTMADVMTEGIRLGPQMISEVLNKIASGAVKRTSQDGKPFYYVPQKPEWDELVDWTQKSDAILLKLRARTPGPRGTFLYCGQLYRILSAEPESLLVDHENVPGQVIGRKSHHGVLVKTGDTGIWITRVELADSGVVQTPKFWLGEMLRQNIDKEIFDLKKRVEALEFTLSRL